MARYGIERLTLLSESVEVEENRTDDGVRVHLIGADCAALNCAKIYNVIDREAFLRHHGLQLVKD